MRPLLLGLAALTLVAGCSSDDSSSADTPAPDTGLTVVETVSSTSDAGPAAADDDEFTIQIRPVLTACFEVLPGTDGEPLALPAPSAVPAEDNAYIPLMNTMQYCQVGPSQADGTVFEPEAQNQFDSVSGTWVVYSPLRPGADGEDVWNALAAQCFERAATCPTGQIAIVVDGVAISVATIQTPEFEGSVQISGNYTEAEARDLARRINAGALRI
ncbi:MAG: hypothetical protein ABMA25_16980 [Ilumatobacteraceae bacterium]